MKTLHMLRHAKSAWDVPGLGDHERGLKKRGKREARLMGAALSQRLSPMSINVSPAQRAQLTLAGVCKGWPALGEFEHTTIESLYTFSSQSLFEWIAGQEDCDALFLIGHNPGMTNMVNILNGQAVLDNLPTAGYAELKLGIDRWEDLMPGCAEALFTLFPRQLR